MKSSIVIIFLSCLLCGCTAVPATDGTDWNAEYAGYSCAQLAAEQDLVSRKLDEIENQQVENTIVGGTMSMLGYSVSGGPQSDASEQPALRRRQDILQHDLIKKNCAYPHE